YREIAQMLEEQPVVVSPATPFSASVGARLEPRPRGSEDPRLQEAPADVAGNREFSTERILPSIVPDEFADNHAVELDACKRWFSSDAGQVAKIEAPAGYANVRAHAQLHEQFLRKQQMQDAALAQAAAAQPSKGKTAAG
ncbi:MAG TPA: hypothetical protein VNF00_04680, partial [Candidatus Acidoferrales bacterium]|nr:hypothetical protein [Candidatus Acidoferrales bacterium]